MRAVNHAAFVVRAVPCRGADAVDFRHYFFHQKRLHHHPRPLRANEGYILDVAFFVIDGLLNMMAIVC